MDPGALAPYGASALATSRTCGASPLLANPTRPVLPPLECCFGTIPIQADKLRPDRKAFGGQKLEGLRTVNLNELLKQPK